MSHYADIEFSVNEFIEQVDKAHTNMKRQAEKTINENLERYKRILSDTIEYEEIMIRREKRNRNLDAAKHHKTKAEIYKSIFDRMG